MQDLVVEVFELAGGLRRGVAAIANLAGQTQAGSHAMRIAATGRLGLAMIARRLGLARQTLRRIADALVADGHAPYEPNPNLTTTDRHRPRQDSARHDQRQSRQGKLPQRHRLGPGRDQRTTLTPRSATETPTRANGTPSD